MFRSTQLSIRITNTVSRAYTGVEVGVAVNMQLLGGKFNLKDMVVILGRMYSGLYAEKRI